jgi:hypothetical protein
LGWKNRKSRTGGAQQKHKIGAEKEGGRQTRRGAGAEAQQTKRPDEKVRVQERRCEVDAPKSCRIHVGRPEDQRIHKSKKRTGGGTAKCWSIELWGGKA